MNTYFHLVYSNKASRPFEPSQLQEILAVAMRKNGSLGITGFLIYRQGYFLQLLEGPEDSVRTIFAKISLDKRHRAVKILAEVESGERIAPDWSMKLLDNTKPTDSAESLLDLFQLGSSKDIFRTKSALQLILKKFTLQTKKL